MQPVRIERSRTQKQESPNGLLIIAGSRPGKWGNPFKLVGNKVYVDRLYSVCSKADQWYFLCEGNIDTVLGLYNIVLNDPIIGPMNNACLANVDHHDFHYILHWLALYKEYDFTEIKGKNISCWCKLTDKCHVDLLLKKANE